MAWYSNTRPKSRSSEQERSVRRRAIQEIGAALAWWVAIGDGQLSNNLVLTSQRVAVVKTASVSTNVKRIAKDDRCRAKRRRWWTVDVVFTAPAPRPIGLE